MFKSLITSRRFAPLFWCQFLSALNDNFVKNALIILILFKTGTDGGGALVALAGAVLVAPFFILSGIGGELADRYDKGEVAEKLKRAEIPVAIVAAVGFVANSVPLLFVALGLYGSIAALFGPIKYGILPALLDRSELPAGNAFVETATFAAILIGTIAGGLAASGEGGSVTLALLVIGFSVLCWFAASLIPKAGAAAPGLAIDLNPWTSTVALLRHLRADRRLWIGGQIVSWFWVAATVVLALMPVLIKDGIGGGESIVTLALVVFTLGIAAGCALAARASKARPNLALVPIGALLMALFSLDLAWTFAGATPPPGPRPEIADFLATAQGWRVVIDLAGLAIAGGLFIVPAFAAVQLWAPEDERARTIGAVNVISAVYMTVGSLLVALLQYLGAGLGILFALLAVGNLVAMVLILRAWGREGIQDVARFLFNTFLKLDVRGLENLPPAGTRAIIAPNHVSLLDAAIMHSILPSHAAFAIDTGMANTWWVKPFLGLVKAEPIDPTRPLGTRHLINAVKSGETLVIFPEGRLTVTGGLMKVYDGTAMIADRADAVVVPVRIDGPERSHFGYLNREQTKKAWFPKTTVTILPPAKLPVPEGLKGKARRQAAGAALQDIMVAAAVKTANLDQTLFDALAEAKETRDTGKPAIEDPLGTRLSYRKLIASAQVLGRKLEQYAPVGANVGVLLPNSAGVAVTFFALQSIGRVPAMLNFTAGTPSLEAACKAATIGLILTSRTFVEKAHLESVVASLATTARIVYLEDIRAGITFRDKLRGFLDGAVPLVARHPSDPAVILFTSGSEGLPKGVVLSHRNVLANAMQSLTRVAVNGQDKVFNVLPVFHSFGLTAGLVMPLVGGVPVYLYPSPLHYRIVPELVYGSNATILFGTDTFLNGYARAAHPYDFARVRLILAGAEAVKERTRQLYMEKFGVRILEGYGVTETAPVLAINTPLANKTGTVGRLSPLMEARLEPVPGITEGGRLFVRGPNVMLGYLRAEKPGVLEPPVGGWHDTGDIVTIDDQGFITIKGRAKRFAKVAGEMVSLSAVEAMAAELWPSTLSVVVALPDARKGERLVLITSNSQATREAFQRLVKAKGASELLVPAEIMIVPSVPLLGSGKPDYVAANALAKQKLASRPAKPEALVPEPIELPRASGA